MRISAHFLRGDVKFFPCASAVGVSPSAKGASKTQERFLERWVFLGKVEGKSEKPRAFRMDLAEGCTALGKWRDEKARGWGAAGWGAPRGDERERRSGREWTHWGRKGAQGAAVQEIMRIFVAD